LVDRVDFVVISGEGVQRAHLEEPGANLDSGIASEATDVTADHLEAPDAEDEVAGDGVFEEGEIGVVVASPVEPVPIGSEGGASGN